MKKLFICIFMVFFLMLSLNTFAKEIKIRVACIGNSITYGAGISNREKNSYPAQLQAYLGAGYDVRNFGVNGCTALSKGDYPYLATKEYEAISDYQPTILLIKLGTNDSKPQNWTDKADFLKDYQGLIDRFRKIESHPRIILMTPIRCFLSPESDISASLIEHQITPLVEELAWKNHLEIIHLSHLFGNDWDQALLPDKLHPSSIGAGLIAKKIFHYLTYSSRETQRDLKQALFMTEPSEFNFHGHRGYRFQHDGVSCLVVEPARSAVGAPWVIRARFWDHEPQTDLALLENGFHLAYCDVADLYGADKAVARWTSFYQRMLRGGLNKKVVLEGMSRGGLIVYNWMAVNPEKVACIYADAPVMDVKSWPMGKGQSVGSASDVEGMLKAYGFVDEKEATEWKRNPIDHFSIAAEAGIPILHVVGDADSIVPVTENTAIFEERMKAAGAPITVLHKPNVGHHPHSLSNPDQIVRFILRATGYDRCPCVHAVPGNEYRSGAGWTEGADWHRVAEDITQTLKEKPVDLLLLGNSITQGWGGSRKLVTYKPGKRVLDEALGEGKWESAGISGDRTQNLLWRIQHGEYQACCPKNVVISIGVNNLIGDGDSPEQVAEGIIAIAVEAKKVFVGARIILMGLLPSGKEADSAIRQKCDRIHRILSEKKWEGVLYLNPTGWFVNKDGSIKDGLYSSDYIHLSEQGYKVWAEEIKKRIQ